MKMTLGCFASAAAGAADAVPNKPNEMEAVAANRDICTVECIAFSPLFETWHRGKV